MERTGGGHGDADSARAHARRRTARDIAGPQHGLVRGAAIRDRQQRADRGAGAFGIGGDRQVADRSVAGGGPDRIQSRVRAGADAARLAEPRSGGGGRIRGGPAVWFWNKQAGDGDYGGGGEAASRSGRAGENSQGPSDLHFRRR